MLGIRLVLNAIRDNGLSLTGIEQKVRRRTLISKGEGWAHDDFAELPLALE